MQPSEFISIKPFKGVERFHLLMYKSFLPFEKNEEIKASVRHSIVTFLRAQQAFQTGWSTSKIPFAKVKGFYEESNIQKSAKNGRQCF